MASGVSCPECGKTYRWKPQLAGKIGKCTCGARVPFPKTDPDAEAGAAKPVGAFSVGDEILAAAEAAKAANAPAAPKPRRPVDDTPKTIEDLLENKKHCPNCGAEVAFDAVVCVECGTDLKTGKLGKTKVHRAPREKTEAEKALGAVASVVGTGTMAVVNTSTVRWAGMLLFGGITAVMGGALWGGFTYVTGSELGYIAWAIGGLTAFGTTLGAGCSNYSVGLVASAFSIAGILVGKAITVYWVIPKWAEEGGTTVTSGEAWGLVFGMVDFVFIGLAVFTAYGIASGLKKMQKEGYA